MLSCLTVFPFTHTHDYSPSDSSPWLKFVSATLTFIHIPAFYPLAASLSFIIIPTVEFAASLSFIIILTVEILVRILFFTSSNLSLAFWTCEYHMTSLSSVQNTPANNNLLGRRCSSPLPYALLMLYQDLIICRRVPYSILLCNALASSTATVIFLACWSDWIFIYSLKLLTSECNKFRFLILTFRILHDIALPVSTHPLSFTFWTM